MRTRFAKHLKTGIVLAQYWYDTKGCRHHKASSSLLLNEDSEEPEDYEDWRWEPKCDNCDLDAPETAAKKVHKTKLYNTPSGTLEPGCFYWNDELPEDYFWNNHKGPHLAVVAPNGFRWVLDSRAKNCKRIGDSTHRCWHWIGDPEVGNISVVPDAICCSSTPVIQLGTWSGELKNGVFYTVLEPAESQQLFI